MAVSVLIVTGPTNTPLVEATRMGATDAFKYGLSRTRDNHVPVHRALDLWWHKLIVRRHKVNHQANLTVVRRARRLVTAVLTESPVGYT